MDLRSGSSVCNADGDIQSGGLATERDYHPPEFSSPNSLKRGNLLEGQRVSCSYHNSKDLTCILDSVENELHFSSKVSLADYIQSFVEKEVNNLIPSPEKDKFSEVTCIELEVVIFFYLFIHYCVEESFNCCRLLLVIVVSQRYLLVKHL